MCQRLKLNLNFLSLLTAFNVCSNFLCSTLNWLEHNIKLSLSLSKSPIHKVPINLPLCLNPRCSLLYIWDEERCFRRSVHVRSFGLNFFLFCFNFFSKIYFLILNFLQLFITHHHSNFFPFLQKKLMEIFKVDDIKKERRRC